MEYENYMLLGIDLAINRDYTYNYINGEIIQRDNI